jgi:GTP cyclohydrolase II
MLHLPAQSDVMAPATPNPLPVAGLLPDSSERVMRARSDLHLGLPVALVDGDEACLVALAEGMQARRYGGFHALGAPELVITRRRAAALGLPVGRDGDALAVPIPSTAALGWIAAMAGKEQHTPFSTKGLSLRQATHVQNAGLALAQTVESLPVIVTVARAPADIARMGLPAIAARDVLAELSRYQSADCVSKASLPMQMSDAGRVHVFRLQASRAEHYAIEIGSPDFSAPVLVRMHSACFTGDVLGSLKCDCGPQLAGAMAAMSDAGGGVLIYLNQEGRGIGLANKMRAYALQDGGLDTVEANHWLGFEDDMRDFRIGAEMLRRMQIARVRLMTNNPAKVAGLVAQNIEVVSRVPLHVGRGPLNAAYLATKAEKSGHLLP